MIQMDLIGSEADAGLDDKINEVREYIAEHFPTDDPLTKFQLGVSGGKDSTACYLLLMELGVDFIPVFADTGNEHPDTVEHAMTLSERTGGPQVKLCRKTFTEDDFRVRREGVLKNWTKPHKIRAGARQGEMMPAFPDEVIQEALEVLHPSGNNFLDMALLHGMWPMRRSQFCTLELKLDPVYEAVIHPLLDQGYDVIMASGVRADESFKRRDLPRHELDRSTLSRPEDVINFRPILDWLAADCFAMHRRHGVEPNPLYKKGMNRVGCMPCIHVNQVELVEIYKRFPEQIERIARWERLVAKVSRWAVFHGSDSTSFLGPKSFGDNERDGLRPITDYIEHIGNKPKVDLDAEPIACVSNYGLCE